MVWWVPRLTSNSLTNDWDFGAVFKTEMNKEKQQISIQSNTSNSNDIEFNAHLRWRIIILSIYDLGCIFLSHFTFLLCFQIQSNHSNDWNAIPITCIFLSTLLKYIVFGFTWFFNSHPNKSRICLSFAAIKFWLNYYWSHVFYILA